MSFISFVRYKNTGLVIEIIKILMYNAGNKKFLHNQKETEMSRIESFKKDLEAKKAVKIIAGIDNFDIENIKKVVKSAEMAGASAVDICADAEIVKEIRSMTELPLFVSSIIPEELARAVELGADAIELGNFDVLYKNGTSFSKDEVLALVKRTINLVGEDVFFSVPIPGEISIADQIEMARELETMHVDLIQTEGHFSKEQADGVRGLMERAELTLSNTVELSRNVEMPIMTATGINPTTAPFAFAAGASAIGCGSCINKMTSDLSMVATAKQLVEIANRNAEKIAALV